MTATVAIQCDACEQALDVKPTKTGLARLPRGWKRLGERVLCDRCWRASFVLRAITLPIAKPPGSHVPTDRRLRPIPKGAQRVTTHHH